jgi:hypothetical protein
VNDLRLNHAAFRPDPLVPLAGDDQHAFAAAETRLRSTILIRFDREPVRTGQQRERQQYRGHAPVNTLPPSRASPLGGARDRPGEKGARVSLYSWLL